ncbi:hypothetical protein [Catenisphaera adipataccumulans]|jgi:hypothetical protein|uniref:Uncharacterized protein n=1 Tax=Catenisphaera adipataccumulans TaxID=700500 RepID=A0A7W8FWX2_9FIRM|nr:hypothetical protein [Catenisphaera adipataccumulans]MBB5183746.1 hypothetical protein [Catenisphaera adipataccumulans]
MLELICFLIALWLFIRLIGLILRLSWGLIKILLIILAVALWPVSLTILLSAGLIAAFLPFILVCGTAYLIGHLFAA